MRIHPLLTLGAAVAAGAFVSSAAAGVSFSITIDAGDSVHHRRPARVTHTYATRPTYVRTSQWPAYGRTHYRRSTCTTAPRTTVYRRSTYVASTPQTVYRTTHGRRYSHYVTRTPIRSQRTTTYYHAPRTSHRRSVYVAPSTHHRRVYVAPSHRPSHRRGHGGGAYYRHR